MSYDPLKSFGEEITNAYAFLYTQQGNNKVFYPGPNYPKEHSVAATHILQEEVEEGFSNLPPIKPTDKTIFLINPALLVDASFISQPSEYAKLQFYNPHFDFGRDNQGLCLTIPCSKRIFTEWKALREAQHVFYSQRAPRMYHSERLAILRAMTKCLEPTIEPSRRNLIVFLSGAVHAPQCN